MPNSRRKTMENMTLKQFFIRGAGFLAVLFLLLLGSSKLAVKMDESVEHKYSHSAFSIFSEKRDTVDVLMIGDSNVYSGVSPIEWWRAYGISGYSFGEGSQTVSDTVEYLKKIYKYQTPKVVLIDGNNMFKDKTDFSAYNNLVRSKLSSLFPIFTLHININPRRIDVFKHSSVSYTKGYYPRFGKTAVKHKKKSRKEPELKIHDVNQKLLKDVIDMCKKKGSQVVITYIPSYHGWYEIKHKKIKELAEENNVQFWDLNFLDKEVVDWETDTCDGGIHLNVSGATKVSKYLGERLKRNFVLEDHRGDRKYYSWGDALAYLKAHFNYINYND